MNKKPGIRHLQEHRAHAPARQLIHLLGLISLGLGHISSGAVPTDPGFPSQWNLQKIAAPAAWEVTTGSRQVVVAVIDTGVNYKHPDLAANMWRNPGETGLDSSGRDKASNGIDDDSNGYVDDVYGIDVVDHDGDPMDEGLIRPGLTSPSYHGTSCAGIIGAVGNNGIGVAGINWTVSIMAIRALEFDLDQNLSQRRTHTGDIEAFKYLTAMKRRGVNIVAISFSYGVASFSQALKDAIDEAGAEGILNVIAAGNNTLNNDLVGWFTTISSSPSVISVAASTPTDDFPFFSSYGKSTVHLAAPGTAIVTPIQTSFSGTSAACPHVSGAIALLKAALPSATATDLKAAILGSVDQFPAFSGKLVSNGSLNIAKALSRLTNTTAPSIVLSALPSGPRTRPGDPIRVSFSRPMNRSSVETALKFTPTVDGRFEWSSDSRTVTLIPNVPLSPTNYAATLLGSAKDDRGETLDGNFDGIGQASPADDFQWRFGFPLPNDDFVNAISIGGATGSVRGTTENASPEMDEPQIANDRTSTATVWYRWTAPTSAWITFDTRTAIAFDTLLGIYTGETLSSLNEIASDDNYGSNRYSRCSFPAVQGTSYSIAVASKSKFGDKLFIDHNMIGPFTLTWYPTPQPSFSEPQRSMEGGPAGVQVTLFGTNFTGATSVLFNGVPGVIQQAPTNYTDLQIVVTVPPNATTGPITVLTPHGNITASNSFAVEEAATFLNSAVVLIPSQGTATPYPSTITVSGLASNLTHVRLTLNTLNHTYPDDLDLLLVGPSGQRVLVMSDAGGNGVLSKVTLTFDDVAPSTLPDSTQIISGLYKPTNFDNITDGLPPPAPAGIYGTSLSAFEGTNPNGTWSLYVMDDAALDQGSIAAGWSLSLTTTTPPLDITRSNTAALTVPDVSVASSYPSTIAVSGAVGVVDKVTVTLKGLTHTYPADLDMLLVGPAGQKIILMSDAGANGALVNADLLFDDTAVASLPDRTRIRPGSYKPTNYDTLDKFPAPAPKGPYGSSFAEFAGSDPNGLWSLFVVDDGAGDIGSIAGGWTLRITTVPAKLLPAVPIRLIVSSIAALPSGDTELTVEGIPGEAYIIEASTNLIDWSQIAEGTASVSPTKHLDQVAVKGVSRFYRARTLH